MINPNAKIRMVKAKKERAAAGMEIANAMQSPAEKAAWPDEEKVRHRMNKDSDQDLGEHRIECKILEQSKVESPRP